MMINRGKQGMIQLYVLEKRKKYLDLDLYEAGIGVFREQITISTVSAYKLKLQKIQYIIGGEIKAIEDKEVNH